jgi:hypothetical protein
MITEAQIVKFLVEKAKNIKATFGAQHYAVAEIGVAFYGPETNEPTITVRVASGGLDIGYYGESFEDAFREAGENSVKNRAAQKRALAAKLISEADALQASN